MQTLWEHTKNDRVHRNGQDPLGAVESLLPQTRMAMLLPSQVFDEETLRRTLHTLADAGWNSVALPIFFEGYPIYFSETWAHYGLRRQHPNFRKWNPIAVAFDVAWRRNLDILFFIRPYEVDRMARQRLGPVLNRYPRWAAQPHPKISHEQYGGPHRNLFFCPVNRDYRRFLCDVLHALLEEYPFHGLLMDLRRYPFFRFPRQNFVPWCYCRECRSRSLEELGFDPASLDFEKEKAMVERWQEWQVRQMDQALSYIRTRALKARATVRVLGLLTSDPGVEESGIQPLIHWKTWVDKSLVEGLVLDRYSMNLDAFEQQVQKDLENLPRNSFLLPMLPRNVEQGEDFLEVFDALPLPGFVTRFQNWEAPDFRPQKRIAFEQNAFTVESDPIRAICVLFQNMANRAPYEEEFCAFLGDLARILLQNDRELDLERLMIVADNVRGLLERTQEGRLEFGAEQDRMIHDLDLAFRLIHLAGCDVKS